MGPKTRRQREGRHGTHGWRIDGDEYAEASGDCRAFAVVWKCRPRCATPPTRCESLEEMAQFARESSFGKKVGTVHRQRLGTELSNQRRRQDRWQRKDSVHPWITHGSRVMPSVHHCRKRKGIGRCGSSPTPASLARIFSFRIISSRISCCRSSNTTTKSFRGSWAIRIACRPYIEEYTAQNYDRMLGEMGGQVQGAEAVRARHEANRAGIPGRESVEISRWRIIWGR